MLVPSVAVGIITKIAKDKGLEVNLFDTTEYEHESTTSAEKRVESLQYRPFDPETDVQWKNIPEKLISDFQSRVKSFKPDIILVSVVEDTFLQAVKLLESIKHLKIPNILGGVFPTASPEKALEPKSVDMVATGEGENIISEVFDRINKNNFNFSNIQRLWTKNFKNGIVKPTSPGKLVDIGRIVPDFSLFNEKRFLRPMGGRVFKTLPLETYRGCPFKCTFCNSPMQISFSKENNLGHFEKKKINEVKSLLKNLYRDINLITSIWLTIVFCLDLGKKSLTLQTCIQNSHYLLV